jgi:hypothetical protein
LKFNESWKDYKEALVEYFRDTQEEVRDLVKYSELKYDNNIEDYLDKKEFYNGCFGLSNLVW